MRDPKVVICTVALDGWHPRGVARMIDEFHRVSEGYEIQAWINALPPNTLKSNRNDLTAYCAKPRALLAAKESGADIVIWMDASMYPIRHIQPMIDYIGDVGYLFFANGFRVGEWSTDAALAYFCVSREEAFNIPDRSGGCIGFDLRNKTADNALAVWANADSTFLGPHTNSNASTKQHAYRDHVGFCSNDPRVLGHRHDQTALSIIASDLGLNKFVDRPRFVQYKGEREQEDTLVLIHGGM